MSISVISLPTLTALNVLNSKEILGCPKLLACCPVLGINLISPAFERRQLVDLIFIFLTGALGIRLWAQPHASQATAFSKQIWASQSVSSTSLQYRDPGPYSTVTRKSCLCIPSHQTLILHRRFHLKGTYPKRKIWKARVTAFMVQIWMSTGCKGRCFWGQDTTTFGCVTEVIQLGYMVLLLKHVFFIDVSIPIARQ